MRDPGFDQDRVSRTMTGKIKGISTTRIVHVDGSSFHEKSTAAGGFSKGGMAPPFLQQIGFCFDDPGFKPESIQLMSQHQTQQIRGYFLRNTFKKIGWNRIHSLSRGIFISFSLFCLFRFHIWPRAERLTGSR